MRQFLHVFVVEPDPLNSTLSRVVLLVKGIGDYAEVEEHVERGHVGIVVVVDCPVCYNETLQID
jgi:hypothetical protein